MHEEEGEDIFMIYTFVNDTLVRTKYYFGDTESADHIIGLLQSDDDILIKNEIKHNLYGSHDLEYTSSKGITTIDVSIVKFWSNYANEFKTANTYTRTRINPNP